jgi:hypothetical protein
MKLLIFASFMTVMIAACSSGSVNHNAILTDYSKIDISDGASENEMKVIAQHFLLVTSEEPCKTDAPNVNIGSPHMKCGWVQPEKKDHGCHVGFPKKGLFEIIPLYIKVSEVTGEASCAGYLILK